MNTRNSKIIWVFGPPCAGKKTLIYRSSNPNIRSSLRKIYGISNFDMMIPIVSAGRGIGHEKQAEARLEVFRDVYKLGKYNWLIHGQPIDYEHVLPVLHRWHKDLGECVYLDVSKEVYEARQVKRKHRPSYEEQYKNRDRDIQTLKGFFREVKIFTV